MSAIIIALPTAAALPVARTKLPRGRPPKNVMHIQRGKALQVRRQYWAERADALWGQAQRKRGLAEGFTQACLEEAARLEIEARHARQKSR